MRSGARWVFTAYSLPLLVPLVLVGIGPAWAAASFALLGAALVAVCTDPQSANFSKSARQESIRWADNSHEASEGVVTDEPTARVRRR